MITAVPAAIRSRPMAEKLGLLNQWLFGDWAERATINRNAEALSSVEANLGDLRKVMERHAKEILQLRAMLMGVVEVLHEKAVVDDAELERAVQAAWAKLSPPPPEPKPASTDPYRGTPGEPSEADIEAAKALLETTADPRHVHTSALGYCVGPHLRKPDAHCLVANRWFATVLRDEPPLTDEICDPQCSLDLHKLHFPKRERLAGLAAVPRLESLLGQFPAP